MAPQAQEEKQVQLTPESVKETLSAAKEVVEGEPLKVIEDAEQAAELLVERARMAGLGDDVVAEFRKQMEETMEEIRKAQTEFEAEIASIEGTLGSLRTAAKGGEAMKEAMKEALTPRIDEFEKQQAEIREKCARLLQAGQVLKRVVDEHVQPEIDRRRKPVEFLRRMEAVKAFDSVTKCLQEHYSDQWDQAITQLSTSQDLEKDLGPRLYVDFQKRVQEIEAERKRLEESKAKIEAKFVMPENLKESQRAIEEMEKSESIDRDIVSTAKEALQKDIETAKQGFIEQETAKIDEEMKKLPDQNTLFGTFVTQQFPERVAKFVFERGGIDVDQFADHLVEDAFVRPNNKLTRISMEQAAMLPDEVIKAVVEKLTPEEIQDIDFRDEGLCYTRQFRERYLQLKTDREISGGHTEEFENYVPTIQQQLGNYREAMLQLHDVEIELEDLLADINILSGEVDTEIGVDSAEIRAQIYAQGKQVGDTEKYPMDADQAKTQLDGKVEKLSSKVKLAEEKLAAMTTKLENLPVMVQVSSHPEEWVRDKVKYAPNIYRSSSDGVRTRFQDRMNGPTNLVRDLVARVRQLQDEVDSYYREAKRFQTDRAQREQEEKNRVETSRRSNLDSILSWVESTIKGFEQETFSYATDEIRRIGREAVTNLDSLIAEHQTLSYELRDYPSYTPRNEGTRFNKKYRVPDFKGGRVEVNKESVAFETFEKNKAAAETRKQAIESTFEETRETKIAELKEQYERFRQGHNERIGEQLRKGERELKRVEIDPLDRQYAQPKVERIQALLKNIRTSSDQSQTAFNRVFEKEKFTINSRRLLL